MILLHPDRATVTLAKYLKREMNRRKWSVSDLEAQTGVSRGALRNLLENDDAVPTLGTLRRLATRFEMPLLRMVELAGFDLGTPHTLPPGAIEKIIELAQAMPELREALEHLVDLPPDEIAGVLAYLEALKRRRDAAGLGPGEPAR
jgi:transcriptional regulator with XRE-family HTH domain